jgi:hypothetical protein
MFLTVILITMYVLIAVLAAAMTLIEQHTSDVTCTIYKSLGFVACAIWPFTFLVIALSVAFMRISTPNPNTAA